MYTRHRRFQQPYHPYRQLKKAFNGIQENESVQKPLAGKEVYDRVNDIVTIFGKTQKKPSSEPNKWKKRSWLMLANKPQLTSIKKNSFNQRQQRNPVNVDQKIVLANVVQKISATDIDQKIVVSSLFCYFFSVFLSVISFQ